MYYKPHPPAKDDWPDYVKRIYEQGCKRIDKLREQIGEDGEVPIPFQCYVCDKMKYDYCKNNGDGCPMCIECLGGEEFVRSMQNV